MKLFTLVFKCSYLFMLATLTAALAWVLHSLLGSFWAWMLDVLVHTWAMPAVIAPVGQKMLAVASAVFALGAAIWFFWSEGGPLNRMREDFRERTSHPD